jgi:hypothetical protein
MQFSFSWASIGLLHKAYLDAFVRSKQRTETQGTIIEQLDDAYEVAGRP